MFYSSFFFFSSFWCVWRNWFLIQWKKKRKNIYISFFFNRTSLIWNCLWRDVTRHQRKPACGVLYQVAQRLSTPCWVRQLPYQDLPVQDQHQNVQHGSPTVLGLQCYGKFNIKQRYFDSVEITSQKVLSRQYSNSSLVVVIFIILTALFRHTTTSNVLLHILVISTLIWLSIIAEIIVKFKFIDQPVCFAKLTATF